MARVVFGSVLGGILSLTVIMMLLGAHFGWLRLWKRDHSLQATAAGIQACASIDETSASQTRIIAVIHPGDMSGPGAVELINLALAVDAPVDPKVHQRDKHAAASEQLTHASMSHGS